MTFGPPRTETAVPATIPAIVGDRVVAVDTLEDLRRADQRTARTVIMRGREAIDDGAAGVFEWFEPWSGTDDGATRVQANTNLQDGGWLRQTRDMAYSVKWFGAKGDWNEQASTGTDDTAAIQAAIDAAIADGGREVWVPPGTYKITAPITISEGSGFIVRGPKRPGAKAAEFDYFNAGGSGALFVYHGALDDQTMFDITNAQAGEFINVGFYAHALAKNCIRIYHTFGDDTAPYAWKFTGCYFTSAREDNVNIEGTDATGFASTVGYGDASGLKFEHCLFDTSYNGALTNSHFKCSTQYTFGITFVSCLFSTGAYPLRGVEMNAGTAAFLGGDAATFPNEFIYLLGVDAMDFPAVAVTGMECQSSSKYLTADASAIGVNEPIRSTVLTGLLCDDINEPIETEMIYWDVGGQASLVLNGCNIFGDVNVFAADANVIVNGSVLYKYADGFGPNNPPGGRAAGFITHPERVSGTWLEAGATTKHRFAALPQYADNAAAVTGGLTEGDLYRTAAGAVLSVLP